MKWIVDDDRNLSINTFLSRFKGDVLSVQCCNALFVVSTARL